MSVSLKKKIWKKSNGNYRLQVHCLYIQILASKHGTRLLCDLHYYLKPWVKSERVLSAIEWSSFLHSTLNIYRYVSYSYQALFDTYAILSLYISKFCLSQLNLFHITLLKLPLKAVMFLSGEVNSRKTNSWQPIACIPLSR